MICDINVDIFSVIQQYISNNDFNNLCNSCKEIKSECKKLRYITLNRANSMLYYEDISFKKTCLSVIENPSELNKPNFDYVIEIDPIKNVDNK